MKLSDGCRLNTTTIKYLKVGTLLNTKTIKRFFFIHLNNLTCGLMKEKEERDGKGKRKFSINNSKIESITRSYFFC